ncbi:MAG: TIGR03620 family F420-dependent LLM class oxidoreductase [Chloroflexi bacterium]|nr:MAG: TIGR03620 family F420-dependent LLM class oxidoreductase [Chloroflexota bacterium]TME48732.1 MAG: TIGR03620 family F420-dependent LLM class oxidoreductase [Chloroflexota bacterium]
MANLPAPELRRAVADIEAMGFGTIWIGEAIGREALAAAALILSATQRATAATGIANIYVRDATAMMNGARTLAEAWPNRFVLGIGVSHVPLVSERGHQYDKPVPTMRAYLDAMEEAPFRLKSAPTPPIMLAALGPKMMALARERTAGAHPYFVPVEHTREARQILRSDRMLAPEAAVVFARDRAAARAGGDRYMNTYLGLDNYRRNLERLGWSAEELTPPGSDRIFDAVVAWGDEQTIAGKLRGHLDAGADHVAVQVLTSKPDVAPLDDLRRLAPLVL